MTAPAYPRYRASGVEWLSDVPEHWEVKRARFLLSVNGSSPALRALPAMAEVSFVPMESVGEFGGLVVDVPRSLDEGSGTYTEFQDGDVVVAKITPCFENGKGALAKDLINGAALGTTELLVLRSSPELDQTFLFYLTISSVFRDLGEAEMYGAGGQKRVPPEFIKDFPTALPSLDEQRAIAAFLGRETAKLDTLIEKKRALIELLKEQRSVLISRTVTRGLPPDAARAADLDPNPPMRDSGIEWLGEIPAHWGVKRLRFVLSKIGSGKTPRGGAETYQQDGVLFLRSQNVYDDGLRLEDVVFISEEVDEEMASSRVEPGDVLLNITGASLGRTSLVPDSFQNANVNQHVCILRPIRSQVHGSFLHASLCSLQVKSQIFGAEDGTSREGLNFDQIGDLVIAVPPIDEQETVASFIRNETQRLDVIAGRVEEAIERLREYRSALITAAVTGKIDVRQAAG